MATDITVRIGGTEILTDERRLALETLIGNLRQLDLDGEIAYRPPTGAGVSWYEMTAIYLGAKAVDAATGHVVDRVIDAVLSRAVDWAKARMDNEGTARPQSITLYGPDGKPLKSVRVDKDVRGSTSLRGR